MKWTSLTIAGSRHSWRKWFVCTIWRKSKFDRRRSPKHSEIIRIYNAFLEYSTRHPTSSVHWFWFCWSAAWFSCQLLSFSSIWWVHVEKAFNLDCLFENYVSLQAFHGSFLDLGISVYSAGITGSILFLYCYFGERIYQNYLSLGDALYESKWRRLPINLQKSLVMIIAVAQRPRQYDGSGLAYMNLNTYLRVSIQLN